MLQKTCFYGSLRTLVQDSESWPLVSSTLELAHRSFTLYSIKFKYKSQLRCKTVVTLTSLLKDKDNNTMTESRIHNKMGGIVVKK